MGMPSMRQGVVVRMNHQQRCQWLAERTIEGEVEAVQRPDGQWTGIPRPDPRFESLRWADHWGAPRPPKARTDSESLDEAAEQFYGNKIFSGIAFSWCRRDWGYDGHYHGDGWESPWVHGETRNEARSAALVAAVEAEE